MDVKTELEFGPKWQISRVKIQSEKCSFWSLVLGSFSIWAFLYILEQAVSSHIHHIAHHVIHEPQIIVVIIPNMRGVCIKELDFCRWNATQKVLFQLPDSVLTVALYFIESVLD